jgi:alpha-beta hydrolase superfamily lysophospholipase
MKHSKLTHPFAVDHQAMMAETNPGADRFVNLWSPSRAQPWASLTILHGLGDHGGRFNNVAISLASAGIGVVAIDLPGHGRSPGRRGMIESYDQLIDEVGDAATFSSRLWEATPSFVLGHSMGGNLVLNWAIRRRFESHSIAGIIAVAPMLKLAQTPKPHYLKVGRWLEKNFPNLRLTAPVDVRQLCSDPIGQDAYRRDPYVHRKMSMRLGMALIDSGQWVLEHAEQLEKPCLMMHGCDDTLTCPKATEAMADRIGSNASLKLWTNARHDLHFELQRESVFNYLIHWMRRQTSTKQFTPRNTIRHAA